MPILISARDCINDCLLKRQDCKSEHTEQHRSFDLVVQFSSIADGIELNLYELSTGNYVTDDTLEDSAWGPH